MLAARMIGPLGRAAAIGLALVIAASSGTLAVDGAKQSSIEARQKFHAEPEARAAMEAIRRRVINIHTLITHRRLPVVAAAHFARDIDTDVARIAHARAAVDLTPDPMTPILQQIKDGAAAIARPTVERGQVDGLVDVVSALETYASSFDHPGWLPLQQQ